MKKSPTVKDKEAKSPTAKDKKDLKVKTGKEGDADDVKADSPGFIEDKDEDVSP